MTAYAREHGGRFMRHGSTAEGRTIQHSDVDIVADFPDGARLEAASFAESVATTGHEAASASASASDRFVAAVIADAVVLS